MGFGQQHLSQENISLSDQAHTDLFSHLETAISSCVEALGDGEFYPRFFQMMKLLARINQYMVFEFSHDGQYAACRLAHNIKRPDLGLKLATLYLEGAYQNDKLLQRLQKKAISDPQAPAFSLLEKHSLLPVYRKRFFNIPHFNEKFAFIASNESNNHFFYINFYHESEKGFEPFEVDDLRKTTGIVGSLLLAQFRHEGTAQNKSQSLLMAGLSEREAQICEYLMKGHTAKTIGYELNLSESTIVTYKSRAFAKLGIRNKLGLLEIVHGRTKANRAH
jgi:DNA-binding CsgD family transcriptional regulator